MNEKIDESNDHCYRKQFHEASNGSKSNTARLKRRVDISLCVWFWGRASILFDYLLPKPKNSNTSPKQKIAYSKLKILVDCVLPFWQRNLWSKSKRNSKKRFRKLVKRDTELWRIVFEVFWKHLFIYCYIVLRWFNVMCIKTMK